MRKFASKTATEQELLLDDIKKTKLALEAALSNFENVVDPDLIDCCIFEVNAVQQRYKFLLKKVRELSVEAIV